MATHHILTKDEKDLIISETLTAREILNKVPISKGALYHFTRKHNITFPTKFKKFIGKKFGKLTIIDLKIQGRYKSYFICKCDCGNVIKKEASRITTNGKWGIKSCGCYRKDYEKGCRTFPNGEAMFNALLGSYKHHAKTRNLPFKLTVDEFRKLTKQNCYYCNSIPKGKKQAKGTPSVYVFSGLDRLNSDLGYIKRNVVPCCSICNRAKNTMRLTDFKNWIRSTYENFVRPNR